MKIGVSCNSVESYLFNDGRFNVTGDSIEAYFLAKAFGKLDEVEYAVVFGQNQDRNIHYTVEGLDIAIHLNLLHNSMPCHTEAAEFNVFFFQNAYDLKRCFVTVEENYDAVLFYSVKLEQEYLELGGKLPYALCPFATDPNAFYFQGYPRPRIDYDICYIGSSITRSKEQYENFFEPLIKSDLRFFLGGRYVPGESSDLVAGIARPLKAGPASAVPIYTTSECALLTINEHDVEHCIIPSRLYDLASCGTLVIAEYHEYLFDFFGNSLYYVEPGEDIVDIVKQIINLPVETKQQRSQELRDKIVNTGLTYDKQARNMLNFCEEHCEL